MNKDLITIQCVINKSIIRRSDNSFITSII